MEFIKLFFMAIFVDLPRDMFFTPKQKKKKLKALHEMDYFLGKKREKKKSLF